MKLNYRTFLAAVGVALSMAVLLGTPPVLQAQQAAGSITGVVTDPSGAPIVNATVTVREVDRGTVWTANTTAAGVYDFPTVPVGNVEVKAEANGFAVEVRKAFALDVDQVARVDFKLQVGAVTETVTVNDAPPLLQTASTEVGTLIDANAASQLPLATRDINQLTLLAPGVLSSNIFAFESAQTTFGTGRPYVNGAREQDNNFILDGMDVNQPDNDEVSYTPSPDAVQEFNIITSNAPADYGNYAGGVIVESMKSGTNAVPRRRLRIRPQHGPGSQHLAGQGRGLHRRLRHADHRPPPGSALERVRRPGGRTHRQEQAVLLCRRRDFALRPAQHRQPEHAGSEFELLHRNNRKAQRPGLRPGLRLHRQRRHVQRCGNLPGQGQPALHAG